MHLDRGYPIVKSALLDTQSRRVYLEYAARFSAEELIPRRRKAFTPAVLFEVSHEHLGSNEVPKAEISVELAGDPCD